MEIAEPVRRRIGGQALGLRRLAGFFEVIGWLELIAGVVLAVAIAAEDNSDSFESSNDNVAAGLVVGLAVVVSALFLIAVARALGLFAEYVAARTGTDLSAVEAVSAAAARLPEDGVWAADPTGRHEFRYWDGSAWTDAVSDGGNLSRDGASELVDAPGPA